MAHPIYKNEGGKRLPSVTTILGKFKDPGALMWWSNDVAVQVLREAVHLLDKAASNFSIISPSLQKEITRFLNSDPLQRANYRNVSTDAATAGTLAHSLVEQYIHASEGEQLNLKKLIPEKLSKQKRVTFDIARKAITSFHAFLAWQRECKFRVEHTELALSSEEHQFGGMIDYVGWAKSFSINQETGEDIEEEGIVIADWKTSKGLYPDYLIQVAAYGILWDEHYEDPVTGTHLLRFDKETGDFHHHYFKDMTAEREMFLHLRECYALLKGVEARAK
jgi:hypothetical protein